MALVALMLSSTTAFTPLAVSSFHSAPAAVRLDGVVCNAAKPNSRRAALLSGGAAASAAIATMIPSKAKADYILGFDMDDEEDRANLQLLIIAAIVLPSPFIGITMVRKVISNIADEEMLDDMKASAAEKRPNRRR